MMKKAKDMKGTRVSADAADMALDLDGVSKSYRDGDDVVHALLRTDVKIPRGEFVAVVGPSGSGKSTFLTIAGGLRTPDTGAVRVGGVLMSGLPRRARGSLRLHHIGFVLQGANLVPFLTVRQQFALFDRACGRRRGTREDRVRVDSILDEFGVGTVADSYPESLSGGERQRVAIAKALYGDPDVLLADEPTASLDSERAYGVVDVLARQAHGGGRAVVMVTHDTRLIDRCDRVLSMRDGRLSDMSMG